MEGVLERLEGECYVDCPDRKRLAMACIEVGDVRARSIGECALVRHLWSCDEIQSRLLRVRDQDPTYWGGWVLIALQDGWGSRAASRACLERGLRCWVDEKGVAGSYRIWRYLAMYQDTDQGVLLCMQEAMGMEGSRDGNGYVWVASCLAGDGAIGLAGERWTRWDALREALQLCKEETEVVSMHTMIGVFRMLVREWSPGVLDGLGKRWVYRELLRMTGGDMALPWELPEYVTTIPGWPRHPRTLGVDCAMARRHLMKMSKDANVAWDPWMDGEWVHELCMGEDRSQAGGATYAVFGMLFVGLERLRLVGTVGESHGAMWEEMLKEEWRWCDSMGLPLVTDHFTE